MDEILASVMHSQTEKNLKLVHFGAYSFDPESKELKFEGSIVKLRPKASLFLQLIIAADGAVVPHDQLYRQIWGDRVVQRLEGLHQLAKDVRHALAECKNNAVINVPGVGYRFEACHATSNSVATTKATPSRIAYFSGLATLPLAFLTYCMMIASGLLN